MTTPTNRDRDEYWLHKTATKAGISPDEAAIEAFVERVAIKLEACPGLSEDEARRQAFQEQFLEGKP